MVAKSKTISKIIQKEKKNYHRATESAEKTAFPTRLFRREKHIIRCPLDENNSVFSVSLW